MNIDHPAVVRMLLQPGRARWYRLLWKVREHESIVDEDPRSLQLACDAGLIELASASDAAGHHLTEQGRAVMAEMRRDARRKHREQQKRNDASLLDWLALIVGPDNDARGMHAHGT